MKNLIFWFIAVTCIIAPTLSKAQQVLPVWVIEMQKSSINYSLLDKEFNEFWKGKLEEDKDGEAKFEEDELPVKEEYAWLRPYIRQYKELIIVRSHKNKDYNPAEKNLKTSSAMLGQWSLAGPKIPPQYASGTGANFGIGRVNQLAFSGTHPNIMYAIAPAGLFITTDTGNTWHSTGTDFIGFHQFRSIAVDPSNDSIIYLGCGDYYASNFFDSGVIKSTDFGNTFTALNNGMDSTLITSIQIDRLNTNHIIAGGWKGIWTSSNGGLNWQHTCNLATTNKIQDIKFKPFSSDTVYATSNTDFLISYDGGNTWNNGFNNFQFSSTLIGELLLGVTEANPDYVYIATMQDFGNIYKSTDGGTSFIPTKLNTAPGLIGYDISFSYGQGDYDFTFSADPFDSLKVYIGSISFYESNDGGANWDTPYFSWSAIWYNTHLHPDQHFIARNPLVPDRIWIANDGGVYSRMDTDTMFVAKQNGLAVTQAYHFDADNFYDSTFVIGTQDNGGSFTNNGNNFYTFAGGDVYTKIYTIYNYSAAMFASGSNLDIHTGSGGYPLNPPEGDNNEAMSFTPAVPATGFMAYTHIWETNDLNGNPVQWRKIFDNTSSQYFMSANHSLADSAAFYAVRSDGYLFRTFNAMDIAPVFDSVPLPVINVWPGTLATIPNNDSTIYLCTYDTVYVSNDKGLTWTKINGSINNVTGFYEIVADPFANDGSVYLAASNKLYYKNDTTGWLDYSNQLPDVTTIFDITVKKFNSQVRKVMADLLCRGIWESPVYQNLVSGVDEQVADENSVLVFPVPANNAITVETANGTGLIKRIFIYDQQGQQVSTTRDGINKTTVTFDVSKFANGIYFMELQTSSGIVMKKILINK